MKKSTHTDPIAATAPAPALPELRHYVVDLDTASGLCYVGTRQPRSTVWFHDGHGLSFETAVSTVRNWKGGFDFTFRVNPGDEADFNPDCSSLQRLQVMMVPDQFGTFAEILLDNNGLRAGTERSANINRWLGEWIEKQSFESRHDKRWLHRVSELTIRHGDVGTWESLVGIPAAA